MLNRLIETQPRHNGGLLPEAQVINAEPDYYGLLGVRPDSDRLVIQAAYRALIRRYHPDANSGEASLRAAEINAAYAILCNKAARAAYDRRRARRHLPYLNVRYPSVARRSSSLPTRALKAPPSQPGAMAESSTRLTVPTYVSLVLKSLSLVVIFATAASNSSVRPGSVRQVNVDRSLATASIDQAKVPKVQALVDLLLSEEPTLADSSNQAQAAVNQPAVRQQFGMVAEEGLEPPTRGL